MSTDFTEQPGSPNQRFPAAMLVKIPQKRAWVLLHRPASVPPARLDFQTASLDHGRARLALMSTKSSKAPARRTIRAMTSQAADRLSLPMMMACVHHVERP